jgi:DNA invertase Pin-like site-specific DNA recombinase
MRHKYIKPFRSTGVKSIKNSPFVLVIGIWFEEQQIDTLTGDGELMMTIIAGFAQEESRSVSENIKWRKRNDMKTGKAKAVKVYGFRTEGRSLAIVPEEAEVVKMVYTSRQRCFRGSFPPL